jgi:hypothetical protein
MLILLSIGASTWARTTFGRSGVRFPSTCVFWLWTVGQKFLFTAPDHLEVVVFESGELGYEVENKTCVLGKNDVIIAI